MSTAARGASRTALGVALQRALHSALDAAPPVLADPVAARLVGHAELAAAAASDSAGTRVLRAHCLLRSAFAEARAAAAVAAGARTVVLLGAGLDTLAYRQPASWAAAGVTVIEVDHGASQRDKRARLAAGGVAVPANVRFCEIDFMRTSLAAGLAPALAAAGGGKEVFIWLGCMMYLDAAAIDATLAFVASRARGSELVFSFAPSGSPSNAQLGVFDGGTVAPAASGGVEAQAAALGEPWLSKHAPEDIRALTARHGFSELHLLEPDEAQAFFGAAPRADGLQASTRVSIGSAVV